MSTLRFLVNDLRNLTERSYPTGTVRTWGDRQYQKQRDGAWVYYPGPGNAQKPAAPTASPAPTPKAKPPEKSAGKPAPKGKLRRALGKAWHTLAEPFVGAYHLATKKSARKEFKDKIGGALKKETAETKEMLGILKKAVTPGQKVSKEERAKAINQVVDLAKASLIGTMYGHIAAQGIGEFLATVASPGDEMLGVLIDKPLRKVTKKIFGHEHGILPSAFYSDEGEGEKKEGEKKEELDQLEAIFKKKAPEQVLLDKILDAVFDEFSKEGISDEDIEAALIKSGVDPAKARKIIAKVGKK
jgi:hypothetical protein